MELRYLPEDFSKARMEDECFVNSKDRRCGPIISTAIIKWLDGKITPHRYGCLRHYNQSNRQTGLLDVFFNPH